MKIRLGQWWRATDEGKWK